MKKTFLIFIHGTSILHPAAVQQYGWKDITANIPAFQGDTFYNGPGVGIVAGDLFSQNQS